MRYALAAAGILSFVLSPHARAAAAVETLVPELVQMIDTSQWTPSLPDPSGLAFLPAGTLLVSDGEVEEIPQLYSGRNVFEVNTAGAVVDTFRTTRFSDEPIGAAVNPRNGTLFLSDDDKDMIFRVRPGADGEFGTRDDRVKSFSTRSFGSSDPEGLAWGGGALFVADGGDAEVYRVTRGRNGVFDGAPPVGDDRVRHFDTAGIGQPDPEGIEFNQDAGTLYIVSNQRGSNIAETTIRGLLLAEFDGSALDIRSPAGLAHGPSSDDPSLRSLYIVDRGIDNDMLPDENDGKIYEVRL